MPECRTTTAALPGKGASTKPFCSLLYSSFQVDKLFDRLRLQQICVYLKIIAFSARSRQWFSANHTIESEGSSPRRAPKDGPGKANAFPGLIVDYLFLYYFLLMSSSKMGRERSTTSVSTQYARRRWLGQPKVTAGTMRRSFSLAASLKVVPSPQGARKKR